MASWDSIGREDLRAAQELKSGKHWRSGVSRAYYAAFHALNHVLLPLENPPHHFRTHLHRQLSSLVRRHLTSLTVKRNQALRTTITRLYNARLSADYDERMTHDDAVALAALRDALSIFHVLEVDHE
jgi:uncharacterized protein (UPF0332 family)